jgi:hypothetical protein
MVDEMVGCPDGILSGPEHAALAVIASKPLITGAALASAMTAAGTFTSRMTASKILASLVRKRLIKKGHAVGPTTMVSVGKGPVAYQVTPAGRKLLGDN